MNWKRQFCVDTLPGMSISIKSKVTPACTSDIACQFSVVLKRPTEATEPSENLEF